MQNVWLVRRVNQVDWQIILTKPQGFFFEAEKIVPATNNFPPFYTAHFVGYFLITDVDPISEFHQPSIMVSFLRLPRKDK